VTQGTKTEPQEGVFRRNTTTKAQGETSQDTEINTQEDAAAKLRAHLSITRQLLEAGANPDAKLTRNHRTPLILAASRDRVDVIKVLVSFGANIHALTSKGDTAIQIAASNNRYATVYFLISRGAEFHDFFKDSFGRSVMDYGKDFPQVQDAIERGIRDLRQFYQKTLATVPIASSESLQTSLVNIVVSFLVAVDVTQNTINGTDNQECEYT